MLPRRARRQVVQTPSILCFSCDGAPFAFPTSQVSAVAIIDAHVRLPSIDPGLLGVALHRGAPCAIVDGHRRLHRRTHEGSRAMTCVVVRTRLGEVLVRVDEVQGLRAITDVPEGVRILDAEEVAHGRVAITDQGVEP